MPAKFPFAPKRIQIVLFRSRFLPWPRKAYRGKSFDTIPCCSSQAAQAKPISFFSLRKPRKSLTPSLNDAPYTYPFLPLFRGLPSKSLSAQRPHTLKDKVNKRIKRKKISEKKAREVAIFFLFPIFPPIKFNPFPPLFFYLQVTCLSSEQILKTLEKFSFFYFQTQTSVLIGLRHVAHAHNIRILCKIINPLSIFLKNKIFHKSPNFKDIIC